MLKKTLLSSGSAILATAVFFPLSTLAQDASADSGSTDDVIIVTATRRASDIQDIPIAVTAVTPTQLAQQGIRDIKSLGSVAAGLTIQSSNTESQGTAIRIRGVGTTGNNIGVESAVGVFIDGVYQSRPGVALGELVDVEQIEVLRGPQGTLFGRNTTAGALVVRNKKPDFNEYNGYVSATYGNFNAVNVQGALNVPLIDDTLAFRLAGAIRKRDGYAVSIVDGSESYERDRQLVRGQLLWEPSDDTSVRFIADYQNTDEDCCNSVVLATTPNFSPALNDLAFPQGTPTDGVPRASFAFPGSEFTGETPLVTSGTRFENAIEQWGVSAEVIHDFGAAELTVIGSYRDFFAIGNQDDPIAGDLFGIGPNGPLRQDSPDFFDEIITYTGEARLQGTAFDDVLDWLVGVYYANEEITELFPLTIEGDFPAIVSAGAVGDPTFLTTVSSVGNLLAGDGTFSPIPHAGAFADNLFSQEGESFSIFTHNIFNITDSLSLTLGARYVDDTKNGRFEQLAVSNPACDAVLGAAGRLGGAGGTADAATALATLEGVIGTAGAAGLLAPLGPGLPNPLGFGTALSCLPFNTVAVPAGAGGGLLPELFDTTFEDDEFIYTIQAGWKPDSNHLVYASFTHGYKAGGINLDSSSAIGGADPRFNSEEVDAYELGLKSTLFDGAVKANIALFYSDLADYQAVEFTGTQFQTFNVADVSSKGVEVELFGQLSETISTNVAVNYTDAQFGADCAVGAPNPIVSAFCGFRLGNSPKWVSIVGTTYDGPLGNTGWTALANINARYESDRRTGLGFPVFLGTQSANVKINARIGATTPDNRFTLELWGQNLTNEITRSITFNTGFVGSSAFGTQAISAFVEEPRTYGVTARAQF